MIDERGHDHHGLAVHEVVLLLETDLGAGLSDRESRTRHQHFGPNVLPRLEQRSTWRRFLAQFQHPLIYVLLVASVLTLLLGDVADTAVIIGVVLLNAAVGFVQESRAEQALEALVAMVHTSACVVRDGQHLALQSSEIVPGDLVVLDAGDKVPADLRLIETNGLLVDESALTGESLPVEKSPLELPAETALADRTNMAYSGTLVVAGRSRGITVGTGAETEMGQIHRLVGAAEGVQTPLTRKIGQFSQLLTYAILGLAVLTFVLGVTRGEAWDDMVNAAVALAVGAIPEGLPAAVTITLAIGVARMARRRAIVRRLPAVETLGSTTVICTDKTGTLTENQMTVQRVLAGGEQFEVEGTGYSPLGGYQRDGVPVEPQRQPALQQCLLAGALCNDAQLVERDDGWDVVGDPTEGALITSARKAGINATEAHRRMPRVDAIPFDSANGYMASLHEPPPGPGGVVYMKGAVERILAMCTCALDGTGKPARLDRDAVLRATDELAGQALRVLAFAEAPESFFQALQDQQPPSPGCTFLGLQAMADPPRPDAIAAVAACHEAGIEVKMITGDHIATATAIARRCGIGTPGTALEAVAGLELAACSPDEFADLVERTSVFARVSPEQKLRLVETLQARHHVVAMTGDGVNDAPALKQADIGIAMGRAGTEVAKESADMVLADDNFSSIEAAVEEGRGIFDNLTKFIVWSLPTNAGEGLIVLAAIIAGSTLPILPIQILWLNMATSITLGLTLAFEPKEAGIMQRQPRRSSQPILDRPLVMRILLVAGVLLAAAFTLFQWEQQRGASTDEARTIVVNAFVMIELAYLLNCRSLERSFVRLGVFTNRFLLAGAALMIGLQLAFTYAPFMQQLFQSAPLDAAAWIRITLIALVAYLLVETEKAIRRRSSALSSRRSR